MPNGTFYALVCAARVIATFLALWIGTATHADEPAQTTAAEDALKVAFVYNFAKFAEWPEEEADLTTGKVSLCVFGRVRLQRQLASIEGKPVGQKRVFVNYLTNMLEVGGCHILFVGQMDAAELKAVVGAASAFPILTISDRPDFSRQGGMVELYTENNRLRLSINNNNVERVGVKLSSKVLKLATIVQ